MKKIFITSCLLLAFIISACGGGGGGGGGSDGSTPVPEELYTLSVTTVGNGTVSYTQAGTDGGYRKGEVVVLTAEPSDGWRFDHWEGGVTGVQTTVSIEISSNLSVTAVFTQQFKLSVSMTGNGTVTINPELSVYDDGQQVTVTAVPDSGWSFDHWSGSLTSADNPLQVTMDADKTITAVFIKPSPNLNIEQMKRSLYAVYGGIGYNDKDDTTDDAFFYDVMVDSINSIWGDLILSTISGDSNYLSKFITFMLFPALPATAKFTSDDDSYTSTLTINRKAIKDGFYAFTATLNIAFNDNGYTYGTSKIYGTGQDSDLSVYFTGHFKLTDSELDPLIIRTVKVTAGSGLKIVDGGITATYNNWELAYNITYGAADPMGDTSIPENLELVPYNQISDPKNYADFRDYTIVGSFTINDKTFSYASGFTYLQKEYSYNRSGKIVSYIMMSANGQVSVPGLDGYVTVSSVLNTTDPVANGTIITHVFEDSLWSDDWVSGRLLFTAAAGETLAVFNTDNSVTFTQGTDSWKVDAWKTGIDPLN